MTIATKPVVLIHRTRTAGYQVIYVASNGRRAVRHRHLGYAEAVERARSLSHLHSCWYVIEAGS